MNAYWIGLSALSTGQRSLDVIGQNITNASTPGYHRQLVRLASLTFDGLHGSGVDIKTILRPENLPIFAALLAAGGDAGRLGARLGVERQSEAILSSGASSIGGLVEKFFNQATQLSSNPDDPTQRRLLVAAASAAANGFATAAGDLDRLRGNVNQQINQTVQQVNGLTHNIAELNKRIFAIEASGGQANDLRDQRDQLISDLSQLVDIRTQTQAHGVVNVIGAGSTLVVGGLASDLATATTSTGLITITAAGSTTPLNVRGGQLGGLLEEFNQVLPDIQNRLNALASSFIQNVNMVQATGLSANGPFTTLAGLQSLTNTAAPLTTAGLPFPVQAGQLAISVTNLASGERTLAQINIDPTTQSLQDVAAAITAGTGGQVQASIDPATGRLNLQAQSGFAFDFAGRLPTSPINVAMNGTAIPTVTGTYTGTGNDQYSFHIIGSGTIGVTPGLQMEVRNSANTVIATLNVGEGYKPGTALAVGNGINVALSAGTTDNGVFDTPVTGQPDTTGLLAALGVNGLFTGSNASTIGVTQNLLTSPDGLSLSRSGDAGDTSNVLRLAGLRDAALLGGRTQTLGQFHGRLIGDVGSSVQSIGDQQTAVNAVSDNLYAQEQSVVGVDINEESVALVQYQRLIESAAKYLAVVNSSLDSILNIIQ